MGGFASLPKTWRTIRHLKARQIVGQIRHCLRGAWEDPARFSRRSFPSFPGCHESTAGDFLAPGARRHDPESLLRGEFEFLNRRIDLGRPPDWSAPGAPKLWQYNLHYFDWLWDLDYEAAREMAFDWIARHPLAAGQVGWEPYPISLRLMNWRMFFFGRHRAAALKDIEFCERLWRSVYFQAEWLARHLETRLLGNHYLENGAALALVGECFRGPAAEGWFHLGLSILEHEIPEQIPADGLHFERSPMYHLRVAYVALALLTAERGRLRDLLEAPFARMLEALEKVCHPDGRIALFNDAAFGVYNPATEILRRGLDRLFQGGLDIQWPDGAWALPDAGYYGARESNGDAIICDAGAVGPDYIPGHAHGDIFSFELSIRGRRAIVDAGVFDYEPGETRRFCRSTAAHNTVEVDGYDQCEFWGAFRVGRRGRPRDVTWAPRAEGFRLAGWHDGYRRLPERAIHRREFDWSGARRLTIRDRVEAARPVPSVARLRLHPDWRVETLDERGAEVACPDGRFRVSFEGTGALSLEPSTWRPEFGLSQETVALAYKVEGKAVEFTCLIEW